MPVPPVLAAQKAKVRADMRQIEYTGITKMCEVERDRREVLALLPSTFHRPSTAGASDKLCWSRCRSWAVVPACLLTEARDGTRVQK